MRFLEYSNMKSAVESSSADSGSSFGSTNSNFSSIENDEARAPPDAPLDVEGLEIEDDFL